MQAGDLLRWVEESRDPRPEHLRALLEAGMIRAEKLAREVLGRGPPPLPHVSTTDIIEEMIEELLPDEDAIDTADIIERID